MYISGMPTREVDEATLKQRIEDSAGETVYEVFSVSKKKNDKKKTPFVRCWIFQY